jgi:hypothetical protein
MPGALASHLRVPARYLCPVADELAAPPDVPAWTLATVAGPAARIYHAMARLGVGPGDLVVFVGTTAEAAIGARLCALASSQALTLPPSRATAEAVRAHTRDVEPRVVHVIETTTRAGGLAQAAALAQPPGSLAFVGQHGVDLSLPRLPLLEVPILVLGPPHPDLLVELLARVVRGELALGELARPVGPEALDGALADLLAGRGHLPCPVFLPAEPS